MIDEEQLELYRRMTPAERWKVWLEVSALAMSIWDENLDDDEIERRWEIWRREHDVSDENMLRGFRAAR